VLMTAGGGYIKLEGGNIEIHAPGMVLFKATAKELAGPMSSNFVPPTFPSGDMPPNKLVIERLYHDKEALAGAPYEVTFSDGSKRKGTLDGAGRATLEDVPSGSAQVRFGAMPGQYERKDKTPMPDYKPKPSAGDIDALIDKYSPSTSEETT
jgi:type VI secretion system secreted protein VgrG